MIYLFIENFVRVGRDCPPFPSPLGRWKGFYVLVLPDIFSTYLQIIKYYNPIQITLIYLLSMSIFLIIYP
jgi:hypothetical protein